MRIAVTRLEEKSEGTIELFRQYGHEAALAPTLMVKPVPDTSSLDMLCSKVASGEVEFLLFSSTMGVKYFLLRCNNIPDGITMIGVGPKTSEAIKKKGYNCETISSFSSDHFASHLGSRIKDKTIGIVRPDVPNPELVVTLTSLGARVIEGIAYQLVPSNNDFKDVLHDVDAVFFTSGKSFNLADVGADDLRGKLVIAIGPKTADVMRQKSIIPHIVGNGTLKDCLKQVQGFNPKR
jgi:uroporphyrinogen-III synthase